jgi:hypothetical protein
MNELLNKLGVPPEFQAFFNAGDLIFNYGDDTEHFGLGFHRVPTTPNLFIAGSEVNKELILTSSVMEAIAFLTLNAHHYTNLGDLSVIAMGNLPHTSQLIRIGQGWQKRKITMVFGKDILGRLTDIKVSTGIRNKEARFTFRKEMIDIEYNLVHYRFASDKLSLSKFEKVASIRSGIRTAKPKQSDTYLNQLIYDAAQ